MLVSIRHVFVFLFVLLAKASAWTLPLGLGSSEAPAPLRTKNPSPQCTNINNGALLCCTAALSGGFPAVQATSKILLYSLPNNTLNGYLCLPSTTTACPGTQIPLCCQVPQVALLWSLWCQSATSACTPNP
ncbi:uncharacterized protein DFL_004379 [Arthrobotrys flagrans]|uniref:Hydrophobin n=1 Tax=Arthrobotrys flagrans TaxID=97331 RepID=A0A437A4M0_ARTFL|nr:hypothetical protein DFL_004379 [Arthrobotrys flagrans]